MDTTDKYYGSLMCNGGYVAYPGDLVSIKFKDCRGPFVCVLKRFLGNGLFVVGHPKTQGTEFTIHNDSLESVEFIRINRTDAIKEDKLEVDKVIETFTSDLKGIEAIDIGNIISYICNWNPKNGLENLIQAKLHLEHLINYVEKEN